MSDGARSEDARSEEARSGVAPPERVGVELQTNFGVAVRVLRQRCGLSLDELAERSGLTAAVLDHLERGEEVHAPASEILHALGEGLGVSFSQLAQQAERCHWAARLRELAGLMELEPGSLEPLPRLQILAARAWVFGEKKAFVQLARELRTAGLLLEGLEE